MMGHTYTMSPLLLAGLTSKLAQESPGEPEEPSICPGNSRSPSPANRDAGTMRVLVNISEAGLTVYIHRIWYDLILQP